MLGETLLVLSLVALETHDCQPLFLR
jgi:hypothetical protein